MSHVSLIMSLQTLFSPEKAKGLCARIGFRLGDASYIVTLLSDRLNVERVTADDCDVVFTGSPTEVAAVIHGGAPLETIGVEGEIALAKRFAKLFPLPAKVSRD
jgi:hypothetical protein